MPWKIEKQDDKFCVTKEDGESEGCHDTRDEATAQLAALNASEKEAASFVQVVGEVEVPDGVLTTNVTGDNIVFSTAQAAGLALETMQDKGMGDQPAVVKNISINRTWANDDPQAVVEHHGPTSWEELDAMHEAQEKAADLQQVVAQFQAMQRDIFNSDAIEDKGAAIMALSSGLSQRLTAVKERKSKWQPLTDKAVNFVADVIKAKAKTEGGVKYPAGDYAYVPDAEKPSTWKLRMSESRPGNVTKAQLGRAAAAFSPGGFRGEKVQIPSGDVAKVKSKIRAAYTKLGVKPDDVPSAIKERSDLMIFKSGDTWQWAAIYSNNYRDRDNPAEILSKAAHKDFVRAVDAGEWPAPELAWWHVKGKPLGVTDWVFFDEKTGCAWAMGSFASKEIAETLANCNVELGISHGMPRSEIRRDGDDPTVITRYRSKEISILPAEKAANLLTGLYSKERNMDQEQKLEALHKLGIDPATLGAEKAAEAEKQGLESKEADVPAVEAVPESALPVGITAEDIGQALAAVTESVLAQMQPMLARLDALEQKAQAPPESVEEPVLPFDAIMNSYKSRVIGNEETKVDGRTKEAKDAPVENRANGFQPGAKVSGDSAVSNSINRIFSNQTAKELGTLGG